MVVVLNKETLQWFLKDLYQLKLEGIDNGKLKEMPKTSNFLQARYRPRELLS